VKRILITGMSGTGKTATIEEIGARGYTAYDLDSAEWSEWVEVDSSDRLTPVEGKDWVWREDRVRSLLSQQQDERLFVSGCAENMEKFFPLIDVTILLSAPSATILDRLATRPASGYGHSPDDRRKVVDLIATIEPLLRQVADFEIDTRQPVRVTVDEILRLVG